MLSIFSCACWPSLYLLWRNVYSSLLPIFFSWVVGFFPCEFCYGWPAPGLTQELTEPLSLHCVRALFPPPPILILITVHCSLLNSDSNDLYLLAKWISGLGEVNSVLLRISSFPIQTSCVWDFEKSYNQWFLTGTDIAPPIPEDIQQYLEILSVVKTRRAGDTSYHCAETRDASGVLGALPPRCIWVSMTNQFAFYPAFVIKHVFQTDAFVGYLVGNPLCLMQLPVIWYNLSEKAVCKMQ